MGPSTRSSGGPSTCSEQTGHTPLCRPKCFCMWTIDAAVAHQVLCCCQHSWHLNPSLIPQGGVPRGRRRCTVNAGPRPVQKCHEHAEAHPLTTAGPRALAGLMHMELTGPSTHMSNAMARATARGPNLPQPLHASTGRSLWQQHFSRAACKLSSVLRRQGLAGKHSSENHRKTTESCTLEKRRSCLSEMRGLQL